MPVDDEWVDRARQDVVLAKLALGAGLLPGAAFHVQQAIEKKLKALLIVNGQRPPKSHDLADLSSRLEESPIPFSRKELASIALWAVSGRYPGFYAVLPGAAEIQAALEVAEHWIG